MSYLEFLVRRGFGKKIELAYLPVGNSHVDIGQELTTTCRLFRHHFVVTLGDLLLELSQCYNNHTTGTRMMTSINWSKHYDNTKYIKKVNNIMEYRFFQFFRCKEEIVSCISHIYGSWIERTKASDEWKPMDNGSRSDQSSFLSCMADFGLTPEENLRTPAGFKQVTPRILWDDGRVDDSSKLL